MFSSRPTRTGDLSQGRKMHDPIACVAVVTFVHLAPVVQRLDNAIHRINHYPVDKC